VMKSIKTSSMILMNRRRAESGEKDKPRTPPSGVRACCNEIGESRRVNAGSLAETPDDATLVKAARGVPACAS